MTTSPGLHNARVDVTRRVQVFLFIYLLLCYFYFDLHCFCACACVCMFHLGFRQKLFEKRVFVCVFLSVCMCARVYVGVYVQSGCI